MSERLQHTAAMMREKMLLRYGDVIHHKHDKSHHPYRQHCRSHPVQKPIQPEGDTVNINESTGLVGKQRLHRFSRGLSHVQIH